MSSKAVAGIAEAASPGPAGEEQQATGAVAVPGEGSRAEKEPPQAGGGEKRDKKEKKRDREAQEKKEGSNDAASKPVSTNEKDRKDKKEKKEKKEKKMMLKALEEDAPAGHEAYSKVYYQAARRNWRFNCSLYADVAREFLVTQRGADGSQEMAGRIARLCYIRYQQGVSRDELVQFRDKMYSLCKKAGKRKEASAGPTEGDAPHNEPEPAVAPGAAESAKAEEASKRKKDSAGPFEGDAPRDEHEPPTAPGASEGGKAEEAITPSPAKRKRWEKSAIQAPPPEGEVEVPAAPDSGGGGDPKEAAEAAPAASANGEAPVGDCEDAPQGSKAHSQVKQTINGVRYIAFFFNYTGSDGKKFRIQTTKQAAGGSEEEAARICRLCYVKAETGASKAEIESYRNELYGRCRSKGGSTAPEVAESSVACAAPSCSVAAEGAESLAASAAPEETPACNAIASEAPPAPEETAACDPGAGEAPPGASGTGDRLADELEDAPHSSKAHRQVKKGAPGVHTFQYTGADGQKFRIQTTKQAAGGSDEEAARICRLCYVRAEAGASKAEVERYRTELYSRCPSGGGCVAPEGAESSAIHAASAPEKAAGCDPKADEAPPGTIGELEDAPQSSKAHSQVKKAAPGVHSFHYTGADGQMFRVQTTTQAAGGRDEESARICRLCYVRAEAGASKAEVERYRNELYSKCRFSGGSAAPEEAAGCDPGAGEAAQCEDAPLGSKAHSQVRKGAPGVHTFHYTGADGQRFRIQTTKQSAGGSDQDAARICRLCYVKAEGGASKAEVERYRNELYRRCRPAGGSAAPEGVEGSAANASATPEEAAGCDPGAGAAVPGASSSGDRPAGELEDAPQGSKAHSQVRKGAPGVHTFHYKGADGQRFRIQTTTKAAGGSDEEAARICRLCYVKAEQGLSKAEVERYRNELYSKCRSGRAQAAATTSAASPLQEPAVAGQAREPAAARARPAGGANSSSSATSKGSSSSSSSSSGSSTSDSDDDGKGGTSKADNRPRAATPARQIGKSVEHGDSKRLRTDGSARPSVSKEKQQSGSGKSTDGPARPGAGKEKGQSTSGKSADGASRSSARKEKAQTMSSKSPAGSSEAMAFTRAGGDAVAEAGQEDGFSQSQLEARRQLEGELQALMQPEALKNPGSIPGIVTRIFDVFESLMGWALVFSAMADTFNAAEGGGGGETSRRMLMYVWHEILDYSHYTNLYEVFSSGYSDFALQVKDAVARAGGPERKGYRFLVDVWERRGFFEEDQAAIIRKSWNLSPSVGVVPLQ